MLFSMGRIAAGFAAAVLSAHMANAAEIKVFSTIGVRSALEELVPIFEKANGHKLTITWGPPRSWSSACRAATTPTS